MSAGDPIPDGVPLPAEDLPRLRPGRSRLPRELIVDNQRKRLFAGAARAVAEHGYVQVSVGHVIEHAGVSRSTFYEHFENKQACFGAAHEDAFDRLMTVLVNACVGRPDWPAKLVAAIDAAIDFAVASPEVARLLLFETLAGEPELGRQVLDSNELLTGLLRNGREQSPQAVSLPEVTERALVGAATAVIGSRLLAGRVDLLPELKPELVHLMLIPYVGSEEARRLAAASASGPVRAD